MKVWSSECITCMHVCGGRRGPRVLNMCCFVRQGFWYSILAKGIRWPTPSVHAVPRIVKFIGALEYMTGDLFQWGEEGEAIKKTLHVAHNITLVCRSSSNQKICIKDGLVRRGIEISKWWTAVIPMSILKGDDKRISIQVPNAIPAMTRENKELVLSSITTAAHAHNHL